MEWLPCPHCGNEHLRLLGNPLCAIYGEKMADVYCEKCQAQAPQKTWNKRQAVTREQRKEVIANFDFTEGLG
jgi:hypothetical protein